MLLSLTKNGSFWSITPSALDLLAPIWSNCHVLCSSNQFMTKVGKRTSSLKRSSALSCVYSSSPKQLNRYYSTFSRAYKNCERFRSKDGRWCIEIAGDCLVMQLDTKCYGSVLKVKKSKYPVGAVKKTTSVTRRTIMNSIMESRSATNLTFFDKYTAPHGQVNHNKIVITAMTVRVRMFWLRSSSLARL